VRAVCAPALAPPLWPALVTLAALAGACGPHVPPTRPSWDQDVFPLLQGTCNHCHGATVGTGPGPVSRLDLCDLASFKARGFGSSYALDVGFLFGGEALGANMRNYVRPSDAGARPLMPPPPAAPLTDYQYRLLETWIGYGAPDCRKQVGNHLPRATVVAPPKQEGDKLMVEVEVVDPDGDQVLGKVKVGGVERDISGTGRRRLDVTGASAQDAVSFDLYDGYQAVQM
jgi:hypothetical protein